MKKPNYITCKKCGHAYFHMEVKKFGIPRTITIEQANEILNTLCPICLIEEYLKLKGG